LRGARCVLKVNGTPGIHTAVRAGLGIGLLPCWLADADDSLVRVLPDDESVFDLWLVMHRDLRHGARWRTIAATYLPASVVYLVLRVIVARISVTEGNSLRVFLGNLELWQDPMWIGLFMYFSVTYIGGLTLVTAADVSGGWRLLREEHEWASFVLPITIAAALVGPDIWRYLVALTPAALVFYARCASQWTHQERIALSITAVALTLWTQRPWEPMNLTRYFTEWFPYYAWRGAAPEDVPLTALWPDWGIRFLVVGLSVVAVTVYTQRRGSAALIST